MLQSLLISAICFGCVSMIFMWLGESRWRKSSLVQGAAKMQMLPVTFSSWHLESNHESTAESLLHILGKKKQKCNIFNHFSATAVLVASAPFLLEVITGEIQLVLRNGQSTSYLKLETWCQLPRTRHLQKGLLYIWEDLKTQNDHLKRMQVLVLRNVGTLRFRPLLLILIVPVW